MGSEAAQNCANGAKCFIFFCFFAEVIVPPPPRPRPAGAITITVTITVTITIVVVERAVALVRRW